MLIGMNASQAFASDDNIPYSFKIKANYANTYSDKEYRQTTNTQNKVESQYDIFRRRKRYDNYILVSCL